MSDFKIGMYLPHVYPKPHSYVIQTSYFLLFYMELDIIKLIILTWLACMKVYKVLSNDSTVVDTILQNILNVSYFCLILIINYK